MAETDEYFKLGEQGESLLPVSQMQVGDKGRKWWGKENASLCTPESKGSASVSVFYLAWCQLPSLPLHGVLGTHGSICVQLPVCDSGHLDESQG